MNFDEELKRKTFEVEDIVFSYLPFEPEEDPADQKTVVDAVNYSVKAGGKRLRPLLMMETYRMFGGEDGIVEPFMAAMEMIHTYSLVHDDLPAMDNDEYRRGKKTTHAVYGEAMGILAGDALLNLAYETAAEAVMIRPDERTAAALMILSKKAGIYGMVGGQVIDVETEGQIPEMDRLENMYLLKTGALISGSMMIGAVLAGATKSELSAVESVGNDVGLAFQIQDDILDMTSSLEVLGKSVHNDEKNNRTTYATLEGLDKAREDVRVISERALSTLAGLGRENEFLTELIRMLITREK